MNEERGTRTVMREKKKKKIDSETNEENNLAKARKSVKEWCGLLTAQSNSTVGTY